MRGSVCASVFRLAVSYLFQFRPTHNDYHPFVSETEDATARVCPSLNCKKIQTANPRDISSLQFVSRFNPLATELDATKTATRENPLMRRAAEDRAAIVIFLSVLTERARKLLKVSFDSLEKDEESHAKFLL